MRALKEVQSNFIKIVTTLMFAGFLGLQPAISQPNNTGGIEFNGDAFGEVLHPATTDIDSAISIELWMKYDESSDENAFIVSNTTAVDEEGYVIKLNESEKSTRIEFHVGNRQYNSLTSESVLEEGQWYHIAAS